MWIPVKQSADEDSKKRAINNLLHMKEIMFKQHEVVFGTYLAIMDALMILLLDSIEKGKDDKSVSKRDGYEDAGRAETESAEEVGKEEG